MVKSTRFIWGRWATIPLLVLCLSVVATQTSLAFGPMTPPPKMAPIAPVTVGRPPVAPVAPVVPPPAAPIPQPNLPVMAPEIPAAIPNPPEPGKNDSSTTETKRSTGSNSGNQPTVSNGTAIQNKEGIPPEQQRISKLPGTATPQKLEGEPVPGVDIKLGKDPGGALSASNTNEHGEFSFGKLAPGRYTLNISGKEISGAIVNTGSGFIQGRTVLVRLLLPTKRGLLEVDQPIPVKQETLVELLVVIALKVGPDGNVQSLDWGKGKVNLAREGKLIPIPKGMQPGELRGELNVGTTKSQRTSGTSGTTGSPQAISDQAATGNLSSFLNTSANSGTTTPQKLEGDPIPGVDIKLGKDPGGALSTSNTNEHGEFRFGKLAPGRYTLHFSGKGIAVPLLNGANPQPRSLLINLRLPEGQQVREVGHEIPLDNKGNALIFAGKQLEDGRTASDIHISFNVGRDGSVKSLNWNDSKGLVDLDREGKLISTPKGVQPGELRGRLSVGTTSPTQMDSKTALGSLGGLGGVLAGTIKTAGNQGKGSGTSTGHPQKINGIPHSHRPGHPQKIAGIGTIGLVIASKVADNKGQGSGTSAGNPQEISVLPSGIGVARMSADNQGSKNHYKLTNILVSSIQKSPDTGTVRLQKSYTLISNIDVVAQKDDGKGFMVRSDGNGDFRLGKLSQGHYTLKLCGNDIASALAQGSSSVPRSVRIGLLIPESGSVLKVQTTVRPNTGNAPGSGHSRMVADAGIIPDINISLDVGPDGSVNSLDWGNGRGRVNLARAGIPIPIPKGMRRGDLSGRLVIHNSTRTTRKKTGD